MTAPVIESACVHRLFEEQAAAQPDAVALATEEGELGYAELNGRANQLAHQLIRIGIGPDRPVGLLLERSTDFVVAALAVLKAGGCYVPLDPDYPPSRLAAMLDDTRVSVVLTRANTVDRLPRHDTVVLCLDEIAALLETLSTENPAIPVAPDHLAYIMYTSGSTGRPKGVMVPHRGVTRLIRGAADYVRLGPDEVLPLLSSVSFDASTFEIWGALLTGARLVVGPAATPSLTELAGLLARHRVTTMWLTAGLFHLVVDELPSALSGVRQLLAGGDALAVPQVRRLLAERPDCQLVNGYGPTEGTTFTTAFPLPSDWQPGPSVPIGRPVPGTRVRILDDELRPVPVGEPGELFVGGGGLARGYLEQPGRTAERFLPDPAGPPGARLYATGDQVRELPDGNLEFLGRLDRQVKIRGYRVELGEIESVLRGHPDVRDIVVTPVGESVEDRRLVAYPVLERPEALAGLRNWLAERLPEALVPSLWHPLDALPLTRNGKVDRAALPAPVRSTDGHAARPADREGAREQEAVAAVFREVLGLPEAGPEDDFFDLGGHSLLATKVVARLRRSLGVDLPISAVFDHPTVAGLADQARLAIGSGA